MSKGLIIALVILFATAVVGVILFVIKNKSKLGNTCTASTVTKDCGENYTCINNKCFCPNTYKEYEGKCMKKCENENIKFPECNECVNDKLDISNKCQVCKDGPDLNPANCDECKNNNLKPPECKECKQDRTCLKDNECIQHQCSSNSDCNEGQICNTNNCPNKCEDIDCKLSTQCDILKQILIRAGNLIKDETAKTVFKNTVEKMLNDDCCQDNMPKKNCVCAGNGNGCRILFNLLNDFIDLEKEPFNCSEDKKFCCFN